MGDAATIVLTVVTFVAVLGGLAGLALRVRRRGTAGGYSLLGVFDEMWHPAALESRVEIQRQDERQAPAPLPGGPSNTQ